MEAADRQRLLAFLEESEAVLEGAAHGKHLPFEEGMEALYRNAWPDIAQAYDATRAEFGWWADDLDRDGDHDLRLAEAGLDGASLELKCTGWTLAKRRYEESVDAPAGVRHGLFRRLLAWANILLGSVASVIPAAEAIKEFKDTVEAGADVAGD